MDGTRLGITFQEAQMVLRNIREKQYEKINPEYSQKYGKRRKHGSEVLINRDSSSVGSPYCNQPLDTKPNDHNRYTCSLLDQGLLFHSEEEKKKFSQPTTSETCSITKRLQSLKEPQSRSSQSCCSQVYPGKRPFVARPGTSSSSIGGNMANDCNWSVDKQVKSQDFTVPTIKIKKSSSEANMDITSYLPKVKHRRIVHPKSETITPKKQTKIQDFGLMINPNTKATKKSNIEVISEKQREWIKMEISSASNIACSLGYADGSTLLRPSSNNSTATGVYIVFPKQSPQQVSENITSATSKNSRCVFFSLSDMDKNDSLLQWAREFLTGLMESCSNKVIYDAQKFMKALIQLLNIEDHHVCLSWQCFDPKIAAWLLDPDHPPEDFAALLREELGKDNLGAVSSKNENDEVDHQISEDLFSLLSLMPQMLVSLQSKNLWELFSEVETKVCPILAVMELFGVGIDTQLLLEYGDILQRKVRNLEQEAFKIVGHQFQLSSTQQLRQILFDQLQLDKKVQKKLARTQIKNYKSTSENVLKHLQEFHPLPKVILEYRHVTKLKSAYVDGILCFVKNETLHTHWNQTCTATGRLTSTNPNIQAIPKNQLDITGVAEEFIAGKEMETFSIMARQAFKSRAGWTFLSADFQSIELRLLAHFSEDPSLLQIFNQSEDDIFVQLASIWLSLDPKSVQNEQRERAKRVVYSVVYGVGKERLAETLGVNPEEAKAFTNSFLATFPGLKKFIQDCVSHCRSHGYVTTIFGRQRLLPGINSKQVHVRSQSERQAVNFVIQGSAADICKMGMILVVRSLHERFKSTARLLIQIHDELLLEVHDNHLQQIIELVKCCLEDTEALCGGHVDLKVNFKVSLSSGKTWAQMEAVK